MSQKTAIAAAALVPLAYLLLYTPYGMDTTDFGYFYAYPWRILQGETPYRDFIYIKPALPLYWHAFWMWLTPENWQVLGGKAGFLCAMLASSWLGALCLGKIFNLRALGLPLPLLATCGFVFGTHSFPHMPWHTVDGVLFSAGALYSAVLALPVPAALLAACALFCKQSFLPVPLAVALLLWFRKPGKSGVIIYCCALLACVGLAYAWLHAKGALAPMRAMTTGQLDVAEALEAGILIYLRQNFWLPLLACLPWLLARLLKKNLPAWLAPAYCYLAALGAWYVLEVLRQKTWIGFGASWPTLFMLLGLMEILLPKYFLPPAKFSHPLAGASIGVGAMLAAAWCVAISGGYKIPAFFATPLVFAFFIVHKKLGGNIRPLAWATLVAGLIMFGAGYQYPYTFPQRPLSRAELNLDAGKIYPKASHVLVDRDMYERLAELRDLRAKYGPNCKTLPAFTFSAYLNGDKPVLSSDWLIDWEINGDTERLYRELKDNRVTVFMERDQLDAKKADAYERAGYTVPQLVRHNWRIVEETPHFVVFQQ